MLLRPLVVAFIGAIALSACGPDRDGDNWDVARADATGDARHDGPTTTDVPRTDTAPPRDVTPPPTDTPAPHDSSPGTDTGGGMCVATCTTDLDCQTSCPRPSTGVMCCQFMTCFHSADMVCPSGMMDSGPTGGDGFGGGGDAGGGFDGFGFDVPFSFDGFGGFDF